MLNGYMTLVKGYWPMLGFGLLTIFWGNFGQSFFISWYGASIQERLSLSATVYGSAYSGATLVSGLMIMGFGGLVDRIRPHYFMMFSGAGLFIAALTMWQVASLPMLVLAFFLLRFFGQGLLPHLSGTTMARYFSLSRGKALSISASGVPLGEIVLPSLAVILMAIFDWQTSWLMIALTVPLIFLPLASWFLNSAPEPESKLAPSVKKSINIPDGSRRTVLADRRFWMALPLVLMPPFVVTGVFIHQHFILLDKQWSPALFAICFTVYGFIHWAISIVTGALVDRYGAVKVFSVMGVPFVFGLLISASFEGAWLAVALMAFMGAGIGMMGTVVGSLWAEVYGVQHLGSIRSLVTSVSILSTAVSPILLGYLIDFGSSANSLLYGLGAYALVAIIMSRFSYRR